MSRIKTLSENTTGRDFVVGDIHGCYDLLMAELEKVGFDKDRDRLISVGDLVDRGESSFECLNLVYEPWFHAVRGNHEELMHEALNGGTFDLWMANGGSWAFLRDSLPELRALVNDAIERLPYAIEIECSGVRVGVIHAEVPNGDWSTLETADTTVMTWGRTRIKRRDLSLINGIDLVISGHTIIPNPVMLGNQLFIDTGAFATGRLTLVDLGELLA